MKIGILVTGIPSAALRGKYGGYDVQFAKMLEGNGFSFRSFSVLDNEFPAPDDDCDGYMITGSAHDLRDDHPWIQPLLAWIRASYEKKPIVGICFGHQAIAQALGGRVDKAVAGWTVGVQRYSIAGSNTPVSAATWHRDQVLEVPPGIDIEVFSSNATCPYAGLSYGRHALSYQSHPEFSDTYMHELFEAHYDDLPQDVQDDYRNTLGETRVDNRIADEIADFFRASTRA